MARVFNGELTRIKPEVVLEGFHYDDLTKIAKDYNLDLDDLVEVYSKNKKDFQGALTRLLNLS